MEKEIKNFKDLDVKYKKQFIRNRCDDNGYWFNDDVEQFRYRIVLRKYLNKHNLSLEYEDYCSGKYHRILRLFRVAVYNIIPDTFKKDEEFSEWLFYSIDKENGYDNKTFMNIACSYKNKKSVEIMSKPLFKSFITYFYHNLQDEVGN